MATISRAPDHAVSPYLLGLRQFGQNPVPKPQATFAASELESRSTLPMIPSW